MCTALIADMPNFTLWPEWLIITLVVVIPVAPVLALAMVRVARDRKESARNVQQWMLRVLFQGDTDFSLMPVHDPSLYVRFNREAHLPIGGGSVSDGFPLLNSENPKKKDPVEVVDALRSLGFESVGSFDYCDYSYRYALLYLNRENGVIAQVTIWQWVGITLELHAYFEDGLHVSVSDFVFPLSFASTPDPLRRREVVADAAAAVLLEKLKELFPEKKSPLAFAASEVKQVLEKGIVQDFEWMTLHPMDGEDALKHLERHGLKLSPETRAKALEIYKEELLRKRDAVAAKCLSQRWKATPVEVRKATIDDSLVCINEFMDSGVVLGRFRDVWGGNPDALPFVEGGKMEALELFDFYNANSGDAAMPYEKVAEITEPFRAALYLGPRSRTHSSSDTL
jgi:hypothetical protein